MYTFLTLLMITFIGAIIYGIWSVFYNSDYAMTLGEKIFFTLVKIIGISFVGFAASCLITLIIPSKQELKIEKTTIECLNDGSSVHGEFFLGSGTVDGKMVYNYYVKNDQFFTLKQLDASSTYITYLKDTTTKPYLEVQKMVDIPTDRCSWNNWAFDAEEVKATVFHIPQGSIKSNYNLDAQ